MGLLPLIVIDASEMMLFVTLEIAALAISVPLVNVRLPEPNELLLPATTVSAPELLLSETVPDMDELALGRNKVPEFPLLLCRLRAVEPTMPPVSVVPPVLLTVNVVVPPPKVT